jgi:hypothetical protein
MPIQQDEKHHDPNWTGDDIDTSGVDPAKTLRKIDLRLIPMLALLYLLSFLDRSNIGNAKIQGMQTDLALTGPQYNLCATVFVSITSNLRTMAPSSNQYI